MPDIRRIATLMNDKWAQWTEKSYFRDTTKLIGKINMKLWSMLFIEYRHNISSCCLWLCYKWLMLLSAIFSTKIRTLLYVLRLETRETIPRWMLFNRSDGEKLLFVPTPSICGEAKIDSIFLTITRNNKELFSVLLDQARMSIENDKYYSSTSSMSPWDFQV